MARAALAAWRLLPAPVRRWPPRGAARRYSGFAGADEHARADVDAHAEMTPHPVSCQDLLRCLEPWRAAKFVHSEMPIRYAERIRWIERIKDWRRIPQLVQVYWIHLETFQAFRSVERHPTLDSFTEVVQKAVEDQREVVRLMATSMHRLQEIAGDDYAPGFIDEFLDGFLLNRFGSNVLMSQYLALLKPTERTTGIIDTRCDAAEVCRQAAGEVLRITHDYTGRRPLIRVEARSAHGSDEGVPRFSYIPSALRYIMAELLKNSCRATVDVVQTDQELDARPINIVVCADDRRVAICTSDQAGGIPFDIGSHVWSYLYSTAHGTGAQKLRANELAGFGVGLPLSRLYARYLGGSLDLISLPGYGVHAYLFLPRLESKQLEVLPDMDMHFPHHSIGEHVL